MEDEKKVKERLENYSYSKIETYEQCHYKFKLKYKDKKFLSQDTPAIAMGLLLRNRACRAGQTYFSCRPLRPAD